MMTVEPRAGVAGKAAQARETAAHYAELLESTALGRLWSRLLEVEFVDRSVALAAKAFVSLFPLLILIAALTPTSVRQQIVEILADRLGLSGTSFDAVRQSFATPDATKAATGIIGATLTVAFAVSFTTALQRLYLRAWRRPPGGGLKNKGRGAVWVGGVAALLIILSSLRTVVHGPTGPVLTWTLGVIGSSMLWWWTARLMVRGEILWRALLPTAVLTGLGTSFYTMAGALWMPAHVANQYEQFGTFGIALAFVTWLTGLAFVLVFAAVLGPALADGDDVLGRWMRSDQPTAVEPGALPALPGPSRPMRLSDAFGRGAGGSGVTLAEPVAPVDVNPADVNPADVNPADVNPADVNPADVSPVSPPAGQPIPTGSAVAGAADSPAVSAAELPHRTESPRRDGH